MSSVLVSEGMMVGGSLVLVVGGASLVVVWYKRSCYLSERKSVV